MSDEVLDLLEAAELLRLNREVLRRQAAAGNVPGALIARRWRFSKRQLLEFVERGGMLRDREQRKLPIG